MSASTPPRSRSWGFRAVASATAASALAAGLATITYRALPGTACLPWDRLGLAIVTFTLMTGVCVGLGVGGGTIAAVRRAPWRTRRSPIGRLVLGGALGGALAGIIPGLFGIAGFGSLHAPYLGTITIVSVVLAAATTFVVLWGPRLLPSTVVGVIGPARRFGLATASAVITAGSAGLLGIMVGLSLHLLPSLAQLHAAAHRIGLVGLAVLGGVVLGAVGGALTGLACGIFVALCLRVAARRSAPQS